MLNTLSYYKKIYKEILKIRILEEQIADRYSEQEMRCPVHLSIGQESVAVTVANFLSKSDYVYSNHRSHAHYIAKGCSLESFIAELYGKENGCVNGRGGSMHIKDIKNNFLSSIPLVSSALGLAVGSALHLKRMKKKSRICVFFGDGSIEEGIFHEALNFAGLYELPIIFICENNLFSVYTHLAERQISDSFIRFADNFNIKNKRITSNNVYESIKQTENIFDYSKKSLKPIFLQFDTYRHREHCGPNFDDHLDYRNKEEVNKFLKNCPLSLAEKNFEKKKLM
ncbi:thiamine pyrophosphate-dependent dehydrogenase E1 component subunit alpha [Alphaproteobacteria bacterium]|nr:thiamine pyrophosphate-dependent dehydrogenase E1 component subunit alpha [Alphaproteobacteria bacterium]